MSENNLVLFEQKTVSLFKDLQNVKMQLDELNKLDEQIRNDIKTAMDMYDIVQFKNDFVTISYVPESESKSIDLKQLQKEEPETYDGLLADFPKVTKKKSYVKILVK